MSYGITHANLPSGLCRLFWQDQIRSSLGMQSCCRCGWIAGQDSQTSRCTHTAISSEYQNSDCTLHPFDSQRLCSNMYQTALKLVSFFKPKVQHNYTVRDRQLYIYCNIAVKFRKIWHVTQRGCLQWTRGFISVGMKQGIMIAQSVQ